jgi:MFS family permease
MRLEKNLIYYLSIIGFFAIFSTTISKSPVLPLFAKDLGASESLIGLIAALSPLAGVVLSFPIGMMADRIGPKKLLVLSGIIFVSAPLMYLFINDPLYLIPIRFFHGLATAILGPVAALMIFETYKKQKGEKIGIYSSATLVGRAIAPLIGGFILSYFVLSANLISYRLVYVTAFLAAIPVLFLILMIKDIPPSEKKKTSISEDFSNSIRLFFSDRRLVSTSLVELASYFAYGVFETYLPLYMISNSFPAYQIGIVFAIQILAIALFKPLFGKLSDRIDRRGQILLGIIIVGFSMLAVPLFSSFAALAAIGVLFSLGLSLSTVSTGAYIADICKEKELGASMGALSSIMDIGQSAGPFVTGMIITYYGFALGFTTSLIVALAVSLVFVLSVYRKR